MGYADSGSGTFELPYNSDKHNNDPDFFFQNLQNFKLKT